MYQYLFHLELLGKIAWILNGDANQLAQSGEVNAAAINISGRQRMLCQRTALLASRLGMSSEAGEREQLRVEMLEAIAQMEKSHNGLLKGDRSLKLPENLSPTLRAMYFQPPWDLDRQVRNYIAEVKALARLPYEELKSDRTHLPYILNAASTQLRESLDAIVDRYQQEMEAEQWAIALERSALAASAIDASREALCKSEALAKALDNLQQIQLQLEQAEKMSSLGEMVVGVAREINNPLNFICATLMHAHNYTQELIGLLRLYQQHYPHPAREISDRLSAIELDFPIEDLPKMLSSMKKSAGRLRELVESLRSFSRIDEAPMKRIDMNESLDLTLFMLQNRLKPLHRHPHIAVVKEFSSLPLVECHVGDMNQVFMNILSNAIDAIEEALDTGRWTVDRSGTPAPTIHICTQVSHPDYVTVRIADNGLGMLEAVQSRIFEPFFTTKPLGKGMGLGLSISYEIVVEKHRGAIWSVSQPGGGAEFWIEIPIRQRHRQSTTVSHWSQSPSAIAF